VSREDAGALESRGEVTGLRVREIPGSPGETELTWDDAIDPVAVFDLVSSDGPFTGTTPVCVAASLASPIVTDPITQPAGTIKYYLVIGHGAAAGPAGMRSDGAIIPSSPVCSAPRAAS